ncbi:baseplate J/gp47 family protein [Anaerovibrio slackiae]|uniref:baseplate J/gp47 family protein n=1 Tax=Anaerovibrio slackiae TaxID=2652309 RepID=UPI00386B9B4F
MSLFEDRTFENLLASALARVSPTLDKREGSLVYNGNAPAMAELAQLYIGLDFVFTATYIATAPREYLIERAKDRGMEPKAASAAVFRAEFNIEVPAGARFSCEDLNFYVAERMPTDEDTATGLSHKVICETAGTVANDYTGALISIEYIDGLASANLVELLIPGDDEEDTEVFRQRILDALQSQAFGGNQADYKQKVLSIDGVAAVKVHPVWNADTPPAAFIPSEAVQAWFNDGMDGVTDTAAKEWLTAIYNAAINKKLTVGGTVRLVVMAANNSAPSELLLETVQTTIDPTQNAGEGMGLAPIGHIVKVDGVKLQTINITTNIVLTAGWVWANAKPYIEEVIDNYFNELAEAWESSTNLVVRISQIESRILQECSAFVMDIYGTQINGGNANITLGEDYIPVRGVINE